MLKPSQITSFISSYIGLIVDLFLYLFLMHHFLSLQTSILICTSQAHVSYHSVNFSDAQHLAQYNIVGLSKRKNKRTYNNDNPLIVLALNDHKILH